MKGQRATIKALERRLKSSQKDNVRWAKLMEDTVSLLTEARGALDTEGGNDELVESIDSALQQPSTPTPEQIPVFEAHAIAGELANTEEM